MEQCLAADDRWMAERPLSLETERWEAQRRERETMVHAEAREGVFIPPLENLLHFSKVAQSGENNGI